MKLSKIKKENAGCKSSILVLNENRERYISMYGLKAFNEMVEGYEKIIKANNLVISYK